MDNRVKIADFIESRGVRYNEFADEIWGYAETAFREHRSMEAQIRLLEEEGFKVTRNVGDVETAFEIYYETYDIHELPPLHGDEKE